MIHQIVICSKERTQLLEKLLRNLDENAKISNIRVLVELNLTDYSDFIERFTKVPKNYNLEIQKTKKGTAGARNSALDSISNLDIVHFIDDDVVLPIGYFREIEDIFNSTENLYGGSGSQKPVKILSKDFERPLLKFLSRMLNCDFEPGRLTRSAANYWIIEHSDNPIRVDWLPGCAMFFSWEKINSFRFNERLELGPLRGYALGEDVDFSFRISRVGNLFYFPSLCYEHEMAKNQARKNSPRLATAQGRFKAYLRNSYPSYFSSPSILSSYLFQHILTRDLKLFIKNLSISVFFIYGYLVERVVKKYTI